MNKRGGNNTFILKKKGAIVECFNTMKAVAMKIGCSIASISKAIETKTTMRGFTIEVKTSPFFVRQFSLKGNLLRKFESISEAAHYMAMKTDKGNPVAFASGIAVAIHSKTNYRFGYKWTRDGTDANSIKNNPVKEKAVCSYMRYDEKTDSYHKCGRKFYSQGNFNHYCHVCRGRINGQAISGFEKIHKVGLSHVSPNRKLD